MRPAGVSSSSRKVEGEEARDRAVEMRGKRRKPLTPEVCYSWRLRGSLVRISLGAGPFAFVEFLQSPFNPANCFRCTKLRLRVRPDGYVLIFQEKSSKNVGERRSQAAKSYSAALHSWPQAGDRLDSWSLTAPCAISYAHCGQLHPLAQDQDIAFLVQLKTCTAPS